MSRINVLPEDLINKIAAGEVIERPASIVKELIENSLDAGATKITVELLDSGKKLIKVSDNGEGMTSEDAKKSILRHTTSKIKDDKDLFSIQTLGFRGEALASIAAVSQLRLTTKTAGQLEGFFLEVEGGLIMKEGIASASTGTIMEVQKVFYNTPARKKFLKTDAVELRHIIDIVIRYALINIDVSFRLLHDNHELVNSPAMNSWRHKIASIYGFTAAKELLQVHYQNDTVFISGFCASPTQARNDKSQQTLYVNKRWIRSSDIADAVYDAYRSTLFLEKHPLFILNLEVNPQEIDVNVHPAKAEIKFEGREKIYQAVFQAVRNALEQGTVLPAALPPEVEQQKLEADGPQVFTLPKPASKYAFQPGRQSVFQVQEAVPEFRSVPAASKIIVEEPREITLPERFPSLKILGQIHKTFFVAETVGGLLYIDQHAAHERVLYEKFMQQYHTQEVEIQQLLQPEILEFSAAEKMIIEENKENLERLGFSIDPFGERAYSIKTTPLFLGRQQPKEIIYEVVGLMREGKQKVLETKEEIITRMACRAAVMAGEVLTNSEIEKILEELSKTKLPYTCPHGRPTLFKVSVEELEKKFKRR